MNQLETYFRHYILNVRRLKSTSADHYTQALRTVSRYLRAAGLITGDIYSVDKLHELYSLREALKHMPEFVQQNIVGDHMYSAGLNRYIEFAEMRKSSKSAIGSVRDISLLDAAVVKPTKKLNTVCGWNRDRVIVEQVLMAAHYQCEINHAHKTFLTCKNDEQYLEGHHLIPISQQDKFENSLDVYANIIGLCPNCHRQLHYGRKMEVRAILDTLYESRAPRFASSGIAVSKGDFLSLAVG